MSKTTQGNFFEDFVVGQEILHATPRTVTESDATLYLALTGSRFAVHCSATLARMAGLPRPPLEDLLTFHLAFGRSVPDVSLNAIANLGYADGRFGALLYPGDTLTASSQVIGLKENSTGRSGTVYVRTRATKDDGREVLEFVRWVMVAKRDPASPAPAPVVPELPDHVAADRLTVPAGLRPRHFDRVLSGSMYRYDSYEIGERIDHVAGMTIDEAEHRLATRLYQNPARVHFDAQLARAGPLRPASGVRRSRAEHRAGAVVQRPRQRPAHRRDQRRHPCQPGVRGRHDLCLVGGPGQGRDRRPSRSRRAAPAPGRDQGPPLRGLPVP